jgi:hypothetical protein
MTNQQSTAANRGASASARIGAELGGSSQKGSKSYFDKEKEITNYLQHSLKINNFAKEDGKKAKTSSSLQQQQSGSSKSRSVNNSNTPTRRSADALRNSSRNSSKLSNSSY